MKMKKKLTLLLALAVSAVLLFVACAVNQNILDLQTKYAAAGFTVTVSSNVGDNEIQRFAGIGLLTDRIDVADYTGLNAVKGTVYATVVQFRNAHNRVLDADRRETDEEMKETHAEEFANLLRATVEANGGAIVVHGKAGDSLDAHFVLVVRNLERTETTADGVTTVTYSLINSSAGVQEAVDIFKTHFA